MITCQEKKMLFISDVPDEDNWNMMRREKTSLGIWGTEGTASMTWDI